MAAGSTYTPITTTTVSGSAVANVTWSSISSAYTDLIIITNLLTTSGGNGVGIQFNGDTASNYSFTYIYGNGSTIASGRASNTTNGQIERTAAYGVGITQIMNYANTSIYKTLLSRGNTGGEVFVWVDLWRNTSAINSIKLFCNDGSNFSVGSQLSLYGITAA
jgi:hypothetical protein